MNSVQTYSAGPYLDQRACFAPLENLHVKYVTTAHNIEQRHNAATAERKGFLKELGYE